MDLMGSFKSYLSDKMDFNIDERDTINQSEDTTEVMDPDVDATMRSKAMKELIADNLSKIVPNGFYIGVNDDNTAIIYTKEGTQRYYADHNVQEIVNKEDGELLFKVTNKSNVDLLIDSYGVSQTELLVQTPYAALTTHERRVEYRDKIVEVPVEIERQPEEQVSPQFAAIKEVMTEEEHPSIPMLQIGYTLRHVMAKADYLEAQQARVQFDRRFYSFPTMHPHFDRLKIIVGNPTLYDETIYVDIQNSSLGREEMITLVPDPYTHELDMKTLWKHEKKHPIYHERRRTLLFYAVVSGTLFKLNFLEINGKSNTSIMLF